MTTIGDPCPTCHGRGCKHVITRLTSAAGQALVCVGGKLMLYRPPLRVASSNDQKSWEPRHKLTLEETDIDEGLTARTLIAAEFEGEQSLLCQLMPDISEPEPGDNERLPHEIGVVEAERYARLFAASPLLLATLRQVLSIHRAAEKNTINNGATPEGCLTPTMASFIEKAIEEATGVRP